MKRFLGLVLFCSNIVGFAVNASAIDFKTPETEAELFSLIDTFKVKTLPQIRTIERCVREANGFALDYQEVKRTYGLKDASGKTLAVDSDVIPNSRDFDLNLIRNFNRISEQNTAFFSEIRNFMADDHSDRRGTLADIEASLRILQKRSAELARRLYPLAAKESQFLYLLSGSRDVIQNHIEKNRVILAALLGKECANASVAWQIAALQTDAKALINNIVDMRDYVITLKRKREAIVDRLLTGYRQSLEKEWREEFLRQGKDSLQSLEGTLTLVRLGSAFDEYWIGATMNGLADSKHFKYLQFEDPLRLLTAELNRLETFEYKFRQIPEAPNELMLSYANKAAIQQKLVRDNIDKLISTGWQGQLNRQIFLNENRQKMADRLSLNCLQAIDLHLAKAKSTKNLIEYRVAESLYKVVVDSCRK